MQLFEITAEKRDDMGKGASRRLRRAGLVPAIVYGGNREPQSVQLGQNELLQQLEHEAFYSHILSLKLAGNTEKVVLKDLQRHPYKPVILHVDLQRVDEKQELTMRVPLHFLNEEKCPGVKTGGGLVSHVLTDIEVICLPKDLPEYIEVDLSTLSLGETIHLGELQMPAGVQIATLTHGGDASQAVVTVALPRTAKEPSEGEEGEEAAEGGEES